MRIGRDRFVLGIIVVAITWAGPGASQEQLILVDSHRLPRLTLDHLVLQGRVSSGSEFLISADREAGSSAISLKTSIEGVDVGTVNLDSGSFPDLDLYTLVAQESPRGEIVVSLRYGQERTACFNNPERDVVYVYFRSSSGPTLYPMPLPSCERGD